MNIVRTLFLIILLLLFSCHINATNLSDPLVNTVWLAKNLDRVVVLDVRPNTRNFYAAPVFRMNNKTGNKQLVKVGGHIPGARHIPYQKIRTTKKVNGLAIKKLIPEKKSFESLLQQAGVNSNSVIVIVTNAETVSDLNAAARMYWQLKYYGHGSVAILDGGMAQWLLDGHEIASKPVDYKAGDWQVTKERSALLATSVEVAQAIDNKNTQLLDVRSLDQYLGANNTRGHIPKAKFFPVDLISNGRLPVKFASIKALNELVTAFNVDTQKEVITYCNSGHMASGSWFVMHALLGNEMTALYDGSMTQWNAEKRPTVRMQFQ